MVYTTCSTAQPAYCQKIQYVNTDPSSQQLDNMDQCKLQSIVGNFLYNGRVVDPTILSTLNDIFTHQAAPIVDTMMQTKMLMDYHHTFPAAKLRYYADDVQLHVESDAAYLVYPRVSSRTPGHFYLTVGANLAKVYGSTHISKISINFRTYVQARV